MQNIPQTPIASRVAAFSLVAALAGGFAHSNDVDAAAAKKPSATQVGKSGLLKVFENELKSEAKNQGLEFPVEACDYRKGQGGIAIGVRGVTGGPNVSDRSVMSSNSDIGFDGDNYSGTHSGNGKSGYSSQDTAKRSWTKYDAGMFVAGGVIANTQSGNTAIGALQQHIGGRFKGRDQLCLTLLDADSAWKNGHAGEVRKDIPFFVQTAAEFEMARPIGDTTFNQAVRGTGKAVRDVTGGFINNTLQGLCPVCPR